MGTKLGRVTTNDPREPLGLSIHASNIRLLKTYQGFYQHEYGDEISMSHLVEVILTRFMRADPAFQQFLKHQGSPPASP
jgi:hypothetical protein